MSFVSFAFFVFVGITVLAYYCVPKQYRWTVLLISSGIFYVMAASWLALWIIFTILTTFFAGLWMEKIHNAQKAALQQAEKAQKKQIRAQFNRKAKRLLVAVLVCNFGVLAAFKYLNLFSSLAASIAQHLGFAVQAHHFSLIMPLGISFYTFQAMGYLIDLYRGRVQADRNVLKFALFLSFFPQIVQGPISRHGELAHQLYEGNDFEYDNLRRGALLGLFGLFKKLVIADRVAVAVNIIFDQYPTYTGWYLAFGVLLYSIQIYCDFSGGVDIAAGVAKMMGITLPHNFERPYFSRNITEFWRRWHMTLGGWCRDYIFYPMSLSDWATKLSKKCRKVFGNTYGKMIPVILTQTVTFVIIGLWHGAQFMHVAFGLYHGGLVVLAILFEPLFKKMNEKLKINPQNPIFIGWQMLRTFILVVFSRYFARPASFRQGCSMIVNTFRRSSVPFSLRVLMSGREWALMALALVVLFVISVVQERGVDLSGKIISLSAGKRWIVYIAATFFVLLFAAYGIGYDAANFIYMGF